MKQDSKPNETEMRYKDDPSIQSGQNMTNKSLKKNRQVGRDLDTKPHGSCPNCDLAICQLHGQI